MKLTWVIVKKCPIQTFGEWEKEFKKQTVIFEENEEVEYPNRIAIDFWGDKLALVDAFNVWDLVKVNYSNKVIEKDDNVFNATRGRGLTMIEQKWEDMPF